MNADLGRLASKVEQIVALCDSLRAENRRLNDRLRSLEGEKESLTERMKEARARLEALMERLPAEPTE